METLFHACDKHCYKRHFLLPKDKIFNAVLVYQRSIFIVMLVRILPPNDNVYFNKVEDTQLRVPHDQVIKWKYFPRYWPLVRRIHRSPVHSHHKGQWRMFSLICAWINDWANSREADDLIHRRTHYGVTVMSRWFIFPIKLRKYTKIKLNQNYEDTYDSAHVHVSDQCFKTYHTAIQMTHFSVL